MPRDLPDLPFVILPEEPLVFDEMGSGAVAPPVDPAAEPVPATDEVLATIIAVRDFHSDPANWCNVRTFDGEIGESACIIKAAARFAPSREVRDLVIDALRDALPRSIREMPGQLVYFNEDRGTTHAELMAFYDRAISLRTAGV